MIDALLHGKLSREQENMEDLLTSAVFGRLKHVPPAIGIIPFLAHAELLDGARPLVRLAERPDADVLRVEYELWPQWPHCEPDVFLTIRAPSEQPTMVAVEVKYLSGKSSEDDESDTSRQADKSLRDQLAREWADLAQFANREAAQAVLVYLTAGLTLPRDELDDSLREHGRRRQGESEPVIAWLSWRELSRANSSQGHPLLADLAKLVQRLGLVFFSGFSAVPPPPTRSRNFEPFLADWGEYTTTTMPPWRFVS